MLGMVEMQKYRKIGPYAEKETNKEVGNIEIPPGNNELQEIKESPKAEETQPRDAIIIPEEPKEVKVKSSTDEEILILRSELDRKGIEYHHRAGVGKLKELLADVADIDDILE